MPRKKEETINKLNENVFKTASYLQPNKGLRPRELKIWKSIVESMNAGYYKECDRDLIMQYIRLTVIIEALMSELVEEDTATVSDKGVVMVNKKIAAIDRLASTTATLSQKLGFAPSTRNRADIKDPSKHNGPVSEMDSLLD